MARKATPKPAAPASSDLPAGGKAATAPEAGAKQAVVIIHGMGEQVPLETIGDFVDTVYARDPAFAGAAGGSGLNVTSMVPDQATGSAELRRVTTHPGQGGKRTDFYELYWADIMEDNPLDLVTSWVAALLLRSPFRVPRRPQIIIIWLLLWLLAVIVVASGLVALVPEFSKYVPYSQEISDLLSVWREPLGMGAIAVGAGLLAFRLVAASKLAKARWGIPSVLVVLGLALLFVPLEVLEQPRVWPSLVTAGVGWLFTIFIGPYFGDVVRYVRATPRTVERRAMVRKRGLDLLKALHEKPASDGTLEYDRIVIVGHSLGTVIAYDLLLHYWVEAGPDHHRPEAITPEVAAALTSIDSFVGMTWKDDSGLAGALPPGKFKLEKYRAAQETLFQALRASSLNWRISDLITLGSPLVHSEFLVVDTPDELERAFHDRRFPTSPPRPDPTQHANPATMLYFDKAAGTGPFAHFAAPFAAVRWVNIHDSMWFPAFGDVVSGPVRPAFGPAVWDYDVKIHRPGWLPLADRIFTHTQYWAWNRKYDRVGPPVHIALLRAALNLDGKRKLPLPPDRGPTTQVI